MAISTSTPERSSTAIEVEKVRAIAARITYSNVTASRQALSELAGLATHECFPVHARDAVTSALRDFLLTFDPDGDVVPGTVRKVRKLTLDALKNIHRERSWRDSSKTANSKSWTSS